MFGGFTLNKQSTTEDDILNVAKEYIIKNGFSSFNIRAITKECGISIGTIYNYFPSKNTLIVKTVASIWEDIFQPISNLDEFDNFVDVIKCMYETIENGNTKYSHFFSLHNLNFASENKKEGVEMMNAYFSSLKNTLFIALKKDRYVNPKMFNKDFPEEKFIDYIFSLVLSTLLKKENPDFLYHFISNYLYSSH